MFKPYPKPEKKEKKKQKGINPISKKRQRENTEYLKLRQIFLESNKACESCGGPADQVHHKKGRQGVVDEKQIPLLIDIRFFMPVCAKCHRKIEDFPEWAKEKGFSLNRIGK